MLELYENIKNRRIALGMTQADLARKTGYTRSMITRIEAGDVDLPQSKIKLFADVLMIPAGDLMGWDGVGNFYLDPETAKMVQSLLDRPEMKVLFDAARDVSKEDIESVAKILEKLGK